MQGAGRNGNEQNRQNFSIPDQNTIKNELEEAFTEGFTWFEKEI